MEGGKAKLHVKMRGCEWKLRDLVVNVLGLGEGLGGVLGEFGAGLWRLRGSFLDVVWRVDGNAV